MTLAPGTRLGPYELLSPIGAGGMGEVWKARDTRLGRIVAIKKVKEQHSERFKQEARSIAALNHPNICQLHDVGPDYLVLEYVEGKPLSSPLPEREAVRLAIQIATALEEAHRNGIIHRDLKPSNIMVTDKGSVKLLDFGLAKLYEQSAGESTAEFPATQAGAVLGTVAYMSPEQAQGQPADARSDIFSFGLVLYEMLSGKRAFAGDTPIAVGAAIMKEEPSALQSSVPLGKIVRRCLAKQASGRYQSISEVKQALEQTMEDISAGTSSKPEQPSIAVLPFVNMSGDKEQEYFSDGLAEEIINALTQIAGLKVIARTSSFAFRGKEQDITTIAQALRVNTVLEGSVRRSGNRIRVTAQLINSTDGSHLWSERYDRELAEVFVVQDEIAQAIAEKLRFRGDHPLVKPYMGNVEAYNLYLKARYHLSKLSPGSLEKSKQYFEQALSVNPAFAPAWAGQGVLYFILGFWGAMPPKAANVHSRQAVLKALELDDTLPEAHGHLGALLAAEYDWQGAEREFRRAIELGPQVWDVWSQYSTFYLIPTGRLAEALAAGRRGLDLDPLSPLLQTQLGIRYFAMGQLDKAIEQFRSALDLDPNFLLAHVHLGFTCIQVGKVDEGIQVIEKAVQLFGGIPVSMGLLGFAYASTGRIGKAQELLEQLQELSKTAYVPAIAFATIYSGLGEIDRAFDWLESAVEECHSIIPVLLRLPILTPLRSHPRYHALLRKMNLEA